MDEHRTTGTPDGTADPQAPGISAGSGEGHPSSILFRRHASIAGIKGLGGIGPIPGGAPGCHGGPQVFGLGAKGIGLGRTSAVPSGPPASPSESVVPLDLTPEASQEHQSPQASRAPSIPASRGEGHPSSIVFRRRPSVADMGVTGVRPLAAVPNAFPRGAVAPAGPVGPPAGGVPLGVSLAAVLRPKVLAVCLLAAAPLLLAIWVFIKPLYSVKAELRIKPIIPIMVYKTYESGEIPYYQSYVNTQVAMVFSPEVLGRVLAVPEVQNTTWYADSAKEKETPMERLQEGLTVMPRPLTEVVDMSFLTEKRAEGIVILNSTLDQYIKYVGELADQTNDALYQKLSEECSTLQNEIEGQESVLAKLKRELGTSTPDELINRQKMRLDDEEAAIAKLRMDITTLQWQQSELGRLASQAPAAAGANGNSNRNYSTDSEWRGLYMNMKMVEMQLEDLRRRYPDTSPSVKQARDRLGLAQEMLHGRENQMGDSKRLYPTTAPGVQVTIAEELEAVGRKLRLMQYEEKLRTEALEGQRTDFSKTFDSAEILDRAKDEIKHRKDMYDTVRARLEQKQMERNVPGAISVLARAYSSAAAAKDRRPVYSFMVLALALGSGMGFTALRSKARQPIYQRADMPHALQVAFLGSLPLVEPSSVNDNVELGERIRFIRTALLAQLNQGPERVFLITSASMGAGKSTVAFMLARSLAACGKSVLLVDADLRNPSLTRRLHVARNAGLVGAMTGVAADEDVICRTAVPNLSFLQAGVLPKETDLEGILGGFFNDSLDRWRQQYDVVLLDRAALPVADASILCQRTDGVILVIREESGRVELADTMELLAAAGGNVIGTVFIESRRRRGYGYEYSGYGERPS